MYVDENVAKDYPIQGTVVTKYHEGMLKAKLIIEIPEEKITITKNQFNETVAELIDNQQWKFPPELREKLFEKYKK